MMHWRSRALVLSALLVTGGIIEACGGSEGSDAVLTKSDAGGTPPPVQTSTSSQATVGGAGGTVTTTGGTGVEIPAGALGANVQVSVAESASAAPPPAATTVGTPYVFGPSGLKFTKPVTVVLEFDATKLPAGKTAADIVVFTAPDGTTDYEPLPTTVRDATHVAAETTHFSVLVPTIPAPGTGVPDAGGETQRDASTCSPKLCGDYGPGTCGTQSDGCGQVLPCGPCPPQGEPDASTGGAADASTGGGGGPDGGCANPLTCANYAASNNACGDRDDGCGRVIKCTETCGGPDASAPVDASTSDAASCSPVAPICEPQKGECEGFVKDVGCGRSIVCNGPCTGTGSDAGGGGTLPDGGQCTPVPVTCGPTECGPKDDGCGHKFFCEAGCPKPDGGTGGGSTDAGGGGGTLPDGGQCTPVPVTCGPTECGPKDDGCGHKFFCEAGCPKPDGGTGGGSTDAGGGGTLPDGGQCTPVPVTCGPTECGPKDDGCGHRFFCEAGCPKPDAGTGGGDVCGDGRVTGPEQCDDANRAPQDGCSSACTIEPGWSCPVPGEACIAPK